MVRGQLRVLLGAAPGVGKTFAMLEEGAQLLAEGRDVVAAVIETHGRAATAALLAPLEVIARRTVEHRGVELDDLDLGAVLTRAPEVALVDELAHTNAPGGANAKRWQDVEALLAAGIDVISTVNVQHVESLGGVVEQITGVRQQETVPDAVLRRADRIELVDLTPQALRHRLESGVVYPAARIDAALSNYFRLGNLTALRELALLWLADEVDHALKDYRIEHGIDSAWEARERVVVALTGGHEGETLVRRGARVAARSSGGELLAVHVSLQHGLADADPKALDAQRALVERLGGTFHVVTGDDVPRALVQFARASHATQLVLGVSRRSRLLTALTGPGISQTVLRESGDIDVHMVNHAAAATGRHSLPRLAGGALARRRVVLGFAMLAVAGPLVTWWLASARSEASITSDALILQLLVIAVALVGGLWPAVIGAIAAGLALDFWFVEPLYTVTVSAPLHLLALIVFVANALLVSWIVDRAARTTRAATRAAAESELLADVAGSMLGGQSAIQSLVTKTREAFDLTGVRLLDGEDVVCSDGEPAGALLPVSIPVLGETHLELHGRALGADERRLLATIVLQLEAVLTHRSIAAVADEVAPLAAQDRVRSALLSAVSHDLRRPLAAAAAAVGSLRSASIPLSAADRSEMLDTADESLTTLTRLVTDLLDVSRVEAGVLAVSLRPTDVDEAIVPALDELGLGPDAVELDLAEVPSADADPVLLQRIIVNVLGNAIRHSPPGQRVLLSTSAFGTHVELRIADHGPGIAPADLDRVFVPFQRLGDTDNDTGLGLGLALSRGFAEGMGGSIEAETTPGGGLTMVVRMRRSGT